MRWNKRTISFDFETSGELPEYALQPWRVASGKAWPTSLVWAYRTPAKAHVEGGLWPAREDMDEMLDFAIANQAPIVGWNTVFDISWLLAYGLKDKVMQVNWLDGMLLWRHLFIEPEYENRHKRRSYGLKEGVRQFLPHRAGYEDDVDFHSTDPEQLQKLHRYNIRDVVFTAKIAEDIWYQLSEDQQNCALIEAACLPLVAEANLNGMMVDTLTSAQLRQHLTDTANALLDELAPHGVTEKVVRSPKQLEKLVFDEWKLPPVKHTATGARSTDKETMHELSFQDDRAAKVKQYQQKRDAMYRDTIQAPPGYTLVEFDAAGQEFRWMAIASGDTTMLRLCEPGQDPHTYMGAQIIEEDYTQMMFAVAGGDKDAKAGRQLGKVGNLSLQYRTSAPKLLSVARVQYGIDMNLHTARTIHETYRRTYPRVPQYWERQISETKKTGYVETFGGRRVIVKGNWSGTWGWSMGSTSINYKIQGTGADQKYLALKYLKPLMVDLDVLFGWDLHDGLYFLVPDQHVEPFIRKGKSKLDNLPYEQEWGFEPPIPLPWDCKVGKSWGTLKERDDV